MVRIAFRRAAKARGLGLHLLESGYLAFERLRLGTRGLQDASPVLSRGAVLAHTRPHALHLCLHLPESRACSLHPTRLLGLARGSGAGATGGSLALGCGPREFLCHHVAFCVHRVQVPLRQGKNLLRGRNSRPCLRKLRLHMRQAVRRGLSGLSVRIELCLRLPELYFASAVLEGLPVALEALKLLELFALLCELGEPTLEAGQHILDLLALALRVLKDFLGLLAPLLVDVRARHVLE